VDHIDLSTITLDKGSHPEDGRGCLLEWTARFARLPVTDHPECTSPVLAAFGIAWNDGLDDVTRQRLIPFIPKLVNTAGNREADERRAWMALDWLVRVHAPAWLRLAKLDEQATALAELAPMDSSAAAKAAKKPLAAAGNAAWAAAWAAARAAARNAAWDAAGNAAWAAAWNAAWAATGDAAGNAAWDAARAAARAAAWDATGNAAWDAARAAARAATGDATGDAARAALQPTVLELQESAFELFDRMIEAAVPVAA
jgi:hypothetical protein